jgi:hypothetical protein
VNFTPPLKPYAQQKGRNAIKGDLFGGRKQMKKVYNTVGLFQRIGSSVIEPPKMRPKTNRGTPQTVAVRLGWERSKTIRIYQKFWRPNASVAEMMAFYKRFQNPQTGRPGWVSKHNIGRWKVQDQMWVSDSAANKLFKHLADRVGYTKAGWLKAANAVGLALPSWVMKHEAYSKGGYEAPSPSRLSIAAISRNSKIPNYFERHVQPAIRSRVRSIASELRRLVAGGKSRRGSLAGTPTGEPN